jgi:hypothetical protein
MILCFRYAGRMFVTKLACIQLMICAVLQQKFGVGPLFHNLAIVDYKYAISLLDCAQAVGYYKTRPSVH